jgi:hypothetical protein
VQAKEDQVEGLSAFWMGGQYLCAFLSGRSINVPVSKRRENGIAFAISTDFRRF